MSSSWLSQAILTSTPAGPRVSATAAAGTVARLRQATDWAQPVIERLTQLPDACERVNANDTLVVDRRGALSIMNAVIAHTVGADYAPLSSLGQALALRTLSAHALGIWDPVTHQRVLFAPNVLTIANRYRLDHKDFARWAVLRTSLWSVHFEHAPHLVEHMADLSRNLGAYGHRFAELVVLLSVLPTVELEQLTTKDLPSLGWIRQHRSRSAWLVGLSLLPKIGMTPTEVDVLADAATTFCRFVMREGLLPLLLTGVETLPSAQEMARPDMWLARVRATTK